MRNGLKQEKFSPARDNHASAAHLDPKGLYLMNPSKLSCDQSERRQNPRRMLGEGG